MKMPTRKRDQTKVTAESSRRTTLVAMNDPPHKMMATISLIWAVKRLFSVGVLCDAGILN